MGYVPDAIVDALSGSHTLGLFLRIGTTPPLHLWFGVNDIPAGFDSIDDADTVYLGGGTLIGIPTLEVLVGGTSDAVDFTLAGLDPATASAAMDSFPPVRGAEVMMGITTLDEYYQPMTAIIPIWSGVASHQSEASQAVKSGDAPTLTLALSVVSGEATRSRGAQTLWSDAHQKSKYPTDRFCDGTGRVARGVQPVWPNF